MTAISETEILDALTAVIDPELGLDIVTLGLVYEIQVDADEVRVVHTLTSPGCPMADLIAQGIVTEASPVCAGLPVKPVLVFTPPWGLEKMSEDARFALGF